MIPREDIINFLINNYNFKNPNYLEIGVFNGNTFKHVNTSNKDGVDPEDYCPCDLVNYKMTSDEFFAKHISKKYDIIFIDGLHTAFQVSKDIYNSINNLNEGGILILDDVYPHSEDEQYGLNLEKIGPNTGDVWKAAYNVLDHLISISEKSLFFKEAERGLLVFKIKDVTNNITIDNSIPTLNNGLKQEWNKYTYKNDFQTYFNKISSLST